jgi:hypothetical protein
MDLGTLKAGAKHEFNKPASDHTLLCCLSPTYMFNKPINTSLNKGLCLATALGVTKFIMTNGMNLFTLSCPA